MQVLLCVALEGAMREWGSIVKAREEKLKKGSDHPNEAASGEGEESEPGPEVWTSPFVPGAPTSAESRSAAVKHDPFEWPILEQRAEKRQKKNKKKKKESKIRRQTETQMEDNAGRNRQQQDISVGTWPKPYF